MKAFSLTRVFRFAPILLAIAAILTPALHAQRMPQDSWYLAKEMAYGAERPKFNRPHGLALGPDANLYVCDRDNHQIQVFSKDGQLLRRWGGYGSAQGQLSQPRSISITSDGKVYVCEAGNNRIQVFNPQGKSLLTMGQPGSGDGQLSTPIGSAVDSAGNTYVADYWNNRIMVFDSIGNYKMQWGRDGDGLGEFRTPVSICYSPKTDSIAVMQDRGDRRIQVFDTAGNYKFRVGGDNYSPLGYAITADSLGNYYVTSWSWNGVWVFDSQGKYLTNWGQNGAGSGPGQFNPSGIVVDNDKVYISDHDNNRIAVFSTNGSFVKNFGGLGYALPIATGGGMHDAAGNVYLADSENRAIKQYDTNLTLIRSIGSEGSGDGQFGGELTLAIGTNNVIYALDRSNQRVEMFGTNGAFLGKFGSIGTSNGKFAAPYGIAVGKEGRVYVTDKDRNQVQVFDARGNYLFKFGKQGSLDAQFQTPQDIVAVPDGRIVVGDRGNGRLQIFDAEGKFLKKSTWNPERLCGSADGNLYGSWGDGWITSGGIGYIDLSGSDLNQPVKYWDAKVNGSLCELPNGDLLHVGYDDVARIWKRTYRVATPDITRGMPLPVIVSQKRRPGTTLVDIDYKVSDSDSPRVTTALLAFKNGGNTLSDVIPMKTFVEGTAANIGTNITTGEVHRVTWDASKDWSTNFANIQFQIIAKDNRDLLNLDFIEIPGVTNATTTNPPLKISKSPLSDNDFLYAMYWCVAIGDPSLKFDRAVDGNISLTLDSNNSPEMTNTINGLWVTRYSSPNWSGNSLANIETTINFARGSDWGDLNNAGASSTYVGMINPPVDGLYNFSISADDGVNWNLAGQQNGGSSQPISLKAGTPVPITINYSDSGGGWRSMTVQWLMPGKTNWSPVPDSVYTTYVSPKIAFGSALIQGGGLNATGREFLLAKMGLRQATPAEITRAKEAGTPGVVNKWTPKFQVGPGERPAAVNAYGFDTGGTGTWVVPITVTNNATN